MIYRIQERLRNWAFDLGVWWIRLTNRRKDRCLAKRLQDLASWYDPR